MHLCIAGSVRAMPEKEKPPAMPVDIYFFTTPDIVNVELYNLVEVEGVEPSSEHIVIQLSPSADSILCFAPTPPADRLRHR